MTTEREAPGTYGVTLPDHPGARGKGGGYGEEACDHVLDRGDHCGSIRDRDLKGLLKFLNKFEISRAYVISEDLETERLIDGKEIIIIPLWKWLLENW